VGIDRLDYTKGICEKFLAIERLLERHPELKSRFSFVQIAEPSRERLAAYQSLQCRVLATAAHINARFADGDWRPIIVIDRHQDCQTVYRLLRAADLCYVGSLHDGMNLVAKEFVSARDDLRGVLVLSQFAGAARELYPASIVNPYDVDRCAATVFAALTMPEEMQASRMRLMRSIVGRFNVYAWAADILQDAAVSNDPMRTAQIPLMAHP
jgi:trehalose 6-phosphate synthase